MNLYHIGWARDTRLSYTVAADSVEDAIKRVRDYITEETAKKSFYFPNQDELIEFERMIKEGGYINASSIDTVMCDWSNGPR